jgi:hypothetical protein
MAKMQYEMAQSVFLKLKHAIGTCNNIFEFLGESNNITLDEDGSFTKTI